MGWFSNRLRRGLTNRAYKQICREVGSTGPASEMYAVAAAAAVYPNGKYGSAEIDRFSSSLPAPVVDPSSAYNIIDSWLDHHQISWHACLSSLYGCDVRELILYADGSSSEEHRATCGHAELASGGVKSMPEMSEQFRQLAEQANRQAASSEVQLNRLIEVLKEYSLYVPDLQLDLAEAAIVWGMASLAFHENRDECNAMVHAIADVMYVSTEVAANTLSESSRRQITVAAVAVQKDLIPRISEISQVSAKELAALEKEDVLRIAAEALHQVRVTYLEHVPKELLPELIAKLIVMCGNVDACCEGVGLRSDVEKAASDVAQVSFGMQNAIVDSIRRGDLTVQDGRIVKSTGK